MGEGYNIFHQTLRWGNQHELLHEYWPEEIYVFLKWITFSIGIFFFNLKRAMIKFRLLISKHLLTDILRKVSLPAYTRAVLPPSGERRISRISLRNIPSMFIGRTDAEAETPMLWPPDVKSQFIGKDPDAGKDWGQEEKGATEDEMVGWHHRLNGQKFKQTPGDSEGQGSLACCSKSMELPRIRQDLMTEQQQQIMLFKEYILTHSQTRNMIYLYWKY